MERESEGLAGHLRELFESGGFWRERWERAGISAPPRTLDGLPIVRPADLAADEAAHPPYGSWRRRADLVRVGVPARPSPLEMLVFSASDLEREARVGARALAGAGLRPGMRATNTLPGGLPTPGSLVVGDAVEALGALDMPVGPVDADASRATAFDFWSRVRPDFAVLDVAGARALAALLAEQRKAASALGLAGIALVTDVRDPEPEVPSFDVGVRRIVGLAEAFSLLAAQEDDGAFYPPSDEVVVEIAAGELVVTALRHSAALARYAPGARAEIVERAGADGRREPGFRLLRQI
ncbi:MAG TPA: hypothetical protein VFD92_11945 [Candidatus Binatia bacterium]|nr:hypothetical protein [Candidatus Binatia bacterium]